MNDINFERHQVKNYLRRVEESKEIKGQIPGMNKFL